MNAQPSNSEPWLSVIMPTFNGAAYLREALESIACQKDSELEVIAVDDGSTDSTISILEEYRAQLNLRIMFTDRRGGWVRSTNLGILEARGTFISFLHQDDCWRPGRIAKLRALAGRHPSASVFLHQSYFIDSSGRRLGRWRCPLPAGRELKPPRVFNRLIVQNFIAIPAPIWKRDALRKPLPLDERLWFTADWKLWLDLSTSGSWVYLAEPLACFRLHPKSQTLTGARSVDDYFEQHRYVLDEYLPADSPDRISPVARFSAELNGYLASVFHKRRRRGGGLLSKAVRLGPAGLIRFFYYSRIAERVFARLRVRLREQH